MARHAFALVVSLFLVPPVTRAGPEPAPLVRIDSGRIAGTRFGPTASEVMFLGIPYALPPTGDRRWKPPEPVRGWNDIRAAHSFAPACPQPPESVRVASREVQEYGETL